MLISPKTTTLPFMVCLGRIVAAGSNLGPAITDFEPATNIIFLVSIGDVRRRNALGKSAFHRGLDTILMSQNRPPLAPPSSRHEPSGKREGFRISLLFFGKEPIA